MQLLRNKRICKEIKDLIDIGAMSSLALRLLCNRNKLKDNLLLVIFQ